MARPESPDQSRCSPAVSLSLPVVGSRSAPPKVRSSRTSRWRFAVLGLVQFLMIAHLVQWLVMGKTLSPVEPSESMETVKNGIVNMGAVLFGLALLSTLVLGRFFCGWGCHVILLQDACASLLGRVGIRPHAFRSRLLLFMPLALALYMWVWPVAYRLAIAPWLDPDLRWPGWRVQLVTTDFWGTFPGVMVAIPFLLVCAFLCVYLLGAKGYCTYGCPYGGFFAPLDELAPGRIRVTDDCEQCGHCTAVCSSNVRVHEEVRDHGMVIDPGCMKCMDCVSVCPNDALYFGLGAPATAAKRRKAGQGTGQKAVSPRRYDLTWPEEIAIAVLALATFLAVRGVYGLVPLLMASGITASVAYLAWKSWRVLREPNVTMHRIQLRLRGRITGAGGAFLAGTAVVLALVVHSGVVTAAFTAARWSDDRIDIPAERVFNAAPMELEPQRRTVAERALRLYGVASYLGDGGIGLAWSWQQYIDVRRAWLLSTLHRFDEAEQLLRDSLARYGSAEALDTGLVRVLRVQNRFDEADQHVKQVFAAHPEYGGLIDEHLAWLSTEGRFAEAIELSRKVVEANPDNLNLVRRLSLLLVLYGNEAELEEGVRLVQDTLDQVPDNPFGWYALAIGQGRQGKNEDAERSLRQALDLSPANPVLNRALGEMLRDQGRDAEAQAYLRNAESLEAAR